ncbi:MAG: hypothetical protein GY724_05090 [Actinomycetia bacterium]|nr:hypothetical protein [Actinomycetes bacterium]MCP5031818.1 hypothetical protein [Actinomycetes bacterium]
MRHVLVGVCLALAVSGCAADEMSLTEYVDGLHALGVRVTPQADALQAEYSQQADPTTDDLKTLLEGSTAIRIEAMEAMEALDPPAQVADLHRLLLDWEASMISVEQALATRAATTADWEQILQSVEADAFAAALVEGSAVCSEFQAELDATSDREAFADTPWLPSEMKEVVEAFLGCEYFPENPEDVFSTPPTTISP